MVIALRIKCRRFYYYEPFELFFDMNVMQLLMLLVISNNMAVLAPFL